MRKGLTMASTAGDIATYVTLAGAIGAAAGAILSQLSKFMQEGRKQKHEQAADTTKQQQVAEGIIVKELRDIIDRQEVHIKEKHAENHELRNELNTKTLQIIELNTRLAVAIERITTQQDIMAAANLPSRPWDLTKASDSTGSINTQQG